MSNLLHHLLTRSATRHADKTAVWARNRSIIYRELDHSSTQLAHLLRGHGLKKGDRVGILFPKCVESVVAMFAVLKAGGIYVPLDPQAPAERVGYIIGDCGIRILLTNRDRSATLPTEVVNALDYCVITDDSKSHSDRIIPWAALSEFPADSSPAVSLSDSDPAYILYTSGSTGRPKGVTLSHRNALSFIEWCAAKFKITAEDRLANHAPLHFDLSVFDIYNTIEAGATVYLVTEDLALFPASLGKFIEERQISIWYSVPSALVLLLLHGNLQALKFSCLRTILFAGEVFPMKYLRQLAGLFAAVDLYNLYGPTETNVCTYYKVERERLGSMEKLPIGIACENAEVLAVNDHGQIVAAAGETGELYVRGASVTSGYWGDAGKTSKVLVPDLLRPNACERIYRTGDLVTLGEDGNYYFLGRRDSMIKSRGYRIELGEIESALLSHPSVREAAALAVPDELVGNRIKAVVAGHQDRELKSVELQQFCAARIPKYMIPEKIEFCESLPKTSTGKIDRVRLREAQGN